MSKVANRENVVDMLDRIFLASLANASRPLECLVSGAFPSNHICARRAALPSRMRFAFRKFRLPLSHAGARTERLDGVEVGSWSTKVLQALGALLRDSVSSAKIRLAYLVRNTTGERTKLLVSLPCTAGWLSACGAYRLFGSAPSVQQVTFSRTKCLLGPAVVRMKCTPAHCTVPRFFAFHSDILSQIEEKYCEVAAKRLCQEVLPLHE